MKRIIIAGAGAAGLMAAAAAAQQPGAAVDIYEKNEKPGKKIYITGKGRCNLTNACDPADFLSSVCTNRKFLYSSFYGFSNEDVMRFFEREGLKIKTERGMRVFPVSDHASDVTKTLVNTLEKRGVRFHFRCGVSSLIMTEPVPSSPAEEIRRKKGGKGKREPDLLQKRRIEGVVLENGVREKADAVIICTGGLAYPSTGSDGDGYEFARSAGHSLSELSPSLVPVETLEEDITQLQGLSLKNVGIRILDDRRVLFEDFGELMFTHFGVTGPLILTASAMIGKELQKHPLTLLIDLKSALTLQQFDERLLREFDAARNRYIRNVLEKVYPSKLIPVLLERCAIPGDTYVHEVTREQRRELAAQTKQFRATLTGLRGFSEAVITRGGIKVKEIHPDTMESRLASGLFFAGEILDVDALTGGFNLQIAWSTGYAAGKGARAAVEGREGVQAYEL